MVRTGMIERKMKGMRRTETRVWAPMVLGVILSVLVQKWLSSMKTHWEERRGKV